MAKKQEKLSNRLNIKQIEHYIEKGIHLKEIFEGYSNPDIGFWHSLLYAILEGASESLDIDRQDLDGCLYPNGRRFIYSVYLAI